MKREILFFLALLLPGEIFAQFINRDEIKGNETYSNYAGRNYENYSVQFNKRKIYDNFGNFLVDGLSIYELGETQSQFVDPSLGGSNVQKSKYYNLWFNNLLIGNDSYGGFTSRIMLGEAIRTKFTSLTMDKARFNGIRWDASTNKYQASVVASRVSDPVRIRFDASSLPNAIARPRDWATYLFGGHIQTEIGDILKVGGTYVNQHQRRSSIDSKESSLQGVVTSAIPRVIFVRVRDDSPTDNSGAILYQIPQVIVNGTPRTVKNINFGVPNQVNTNHNNPIQYYVFRNFKLSREVWRPGGVPVVDPISNEIKYQNFTNYQSYKTHFGNIKPPALPIELKGNSNLVYAFVMPSETQSFTVQLLLSNDYAIDVAHDFVHTTDDYPKIGEPNFQINHYDSTRSGTPTPFFTIERANGNVQDASNKRWVTYSYGMNTGMAVYGLNFQFNWLGFEIEGEFNKSESYSKYPLLPGGRSTRSSSAFYIRGIKKLGRLLLGAERYRIEPWYTTSLNHFTLENSFYSRYDDQGNLIYTPPDQYGYSADDLNKTRTDGFLPGGANYSLVDDNDDNDRWEDGFYFYNADVNTAFRRNGDVLNDAADPFLLGYRQNVNELTGLNDIIRKPDAGIFPGKDKDRDGIPDDDRNSNGLPDYTEDFLTYYSDPPSFEAGDDWNNNSIIDRQENDIYPDYPYDPDIDGYHYFGSLEAMKDLNFTAGLIREDGIARGGKNNVNYLKTTYSISSPRLGQFELYHTIKRVRDNVPNDGYQFAGVISADPTPAFVRDLLQYRNSLANIFYIGTRYQQIPNLNIENNVRYENNKQFKVGFPSLEKLKFGPLYDEQFDGERISVGLVNKIDYQYSFLNNKFILRPQFKIRTLKIVTKNTYDDSTTSTTISTHTQSLIPILRLDYKLTENTELHFGVQGTGLFGLTDAFLVKNRFLRDGVGDYNASTTALSLTNKTQYSGYNIVIDFGYKITNYEFQRPADKEFNTQFSLIYFTVFAGY